MNIRKTITIFLVLLSAFALLCTTVLADGQPDETFIADGLVFYTVPDNSAAAFRITKSDRGGYVLFLPAGADASSLPFSFPFPEGSSLVFTCGDERQTYDCDSAADLAALMCGGSPAELSIALYDDADASAP